MFPMQPDREIPTHHPYIWMYGDADGWTGAGGRVDQWGWVVDIHTYMGSP